MGIVNLDDLPLSVFEVDCDGSACGSANVQRHVHPPQHGDEALARVTVRDGMRGEYSAPEGIRRLVMLEET